MKVLACRAIWRVTPEDRELAKNQICSKRLMLDELLAKIAGVQFFFSCITMMRSNSKRARCGEEKGKEAEIYPGVAYFIAYRQNDLCDENAIFATLHNADMEPMITKIHASSAAATLLQVLKDHANTCVQNLVNASNTYCLARAMDELSEDEDVPESGRLYSTKPCRIVVVNTVEFLIGMTNAYERLQSDGLVADMTTLSNPNPHTLVTNASDLTKTFRDIQTAMQLCNHGLYQGNVYSRPNLASFTYAHMMDVESYLHHVMSNDSLRERVLKHFTVLSKTLAHKDCTIIPQLQFDNDIIEVLGGKVFQISSRSFVPCPIRPESIGKISPRSFAEYDSTTVPDAGYFEHAIINSFPDQVERINFLNKFYQCLVAGKTPLKVRKLVVAGPRDSGKTSWSAIFHRVIPAQYIATITKERQFSAAMMNEFTQLVFIDEWSTSSMDSELAKTILQGGWMKTSVKHQQPRCFFSTCPFYITANEVPDFGG